MSPVGGFRNRRHYRRTNDVLLRQLIVRWKHRAIDLLFFEKTTCFNIGNGQYRQPFLSYLCSFSSTMASMKMTSSCVIILHISLSNSVFCSSARILNGLCLTLIACIAYTQGFMQDDNVTGRDFGKVSFACAVGCFGTSQLEHATRFRTFPFQHVTMTYSTNTEGFMQCIISARRQDL